MNPLDYEFTVTEIDTKLEPTLGSVSTNVNYPILEIRKQDQTSTTFFSAVWNRRKEALVEHCKICNTPHPAWCNWNVVGWAKARPSENQLRSAAWVGDVMVGFVNLREKFASSITPTNGTIYIEHILY